MYTKGYFKKVRYNIMKKTLAVIIAILTAFSAVSVYAENEKTAEILKTVKERIEIPAELNEFESSIRESGNGTEYMFEWSSDEGYLCVGCNDDKIITYYMHYETEAAGVDRTPAFPTTDAEALREAAKAAVKKINPELEFTVTERNMSLYGEQVSFDLNRTQNGIEIVGDSGFIRLNSDDLSVRGMSLSYTAVSSYEDGEVITLEKAQKTFAEKLGLELVYKRYYGKDGYEFFPAYVNENGNKYINAVTGEVFEYKPYSEYYMKNELSSESAADSGGSGGFTKEEQAELDKLDNLLSKEQIEKKVRENKLISIPKTYELASFSLNRLYDDENEYAYGMSFSDGQKSIRVYADAKTGEIYSLNAVEDWDAVERADRITCETAVKKLTPSLSEKYIFDGEKMLRYENGVRVFGDTANVYTDKSGKPVYYSITYSRGGEFADLSNALTADEAVEKMFEIGGYKLKYFINDDKKAYLAYDFDKNVIIHALSGKSVGYDGKEISDGGYIYSDLENHYAKEYIEKLAKYGIGFSGGEFKPNEYITETEFCELLSAVADMYPSNTSDELITRETAAVCFVKALGLDGAAKYDDIFIQPFKDVTQNIGYIAILKAMGVFSGDENGNFNPQNYITRAESAMMLYKYLSK